MSTERQQELAALHLFDLLEERERLAFEADLAASSELRDFVHAHAEAADALAFAAPAVPPPAGLKDRILAAAETRATPPAAPITRFPLQAVLPWAVAAGLALAAVWFGGQTLLLRSENTTLRVERDLAESAYKLASTQLTERSFIAEKLINDLGQKLRAQDDLTRLKVTALASLAGNTREAQAIAVWDPNGQAGLLTIEKLPALAATQDYQIWIIDPAYQNPVNGGVFSTGPDGKIALPFKPDQPVTQATAFAISVEKKGGVPKAEGPIVLLGK